MYAGGILSAGLAGLLAAAGPVEPAAIADAIRTIQSAGPDAAGAETARAAVETLIAAGPKAIPAILAALPAEVVVANWLRTAHDRIVDRAIEQKQVLPLAELQAIAADRRQPGRARRLAVDTLDRVQPGMRSKLLESGLDDPEFGPDAVAQRMQQAADADAKGDKETAIRQYREAFVAAADFTQCLALAQRLKALGVIVDPLPRLGVVRDWMLLGPFDDPDEKGYATAFPPENRIDLTARYDGKSGTIAWKRHTAETPDGRVDLLKAIAPVEGAVAYAHAVLTSPKEQEVELRAAGDDNLAVWLNGTRVIDHPTYRSHVRVDWHRRKVKLRAGDNVVLVKVCQCPAPKEKAPGPPNRWEFHLRLVDADGRGVVLPVAP